MPTSATPSPTTSFNEATSALDSLTEQQVTEAVQRISAQRTRIVLLIARRLSTVLHADVIHVLEKGRIIESGTHAELVAQKGPYFAMWRQQIGEREAAPTPPAEPEPPPAVPESRW